MKNFNELRANLKKDNKDLKKVKVAVLADSASQFFVSALQATAYDYNLNLEIFEADYDQIENQIFDANSELYQFQPEITIVYESSTKLLKNYYKYPTENFGKTKIENIQQLYEIFAGNGLHNFYYLNFPIINNKVFGNYAYKLAFSFPSQLEFINYELTLLAQNIKDFYLIDAKNIQNILGISTTQNRSLNINANIDFSLDALPHLADSIVGFIAAQKGYFKKCLILDLDNTTWGGIIGDDGIEKIQIGNLGIGKAFTELQLWAKALKERGVILAVCSKNDEDKAKEPFEKHPDMVLKLDDISVFVANWDNKADNIRKIQKILNIGFDSMVFLDDNPVERNIVRENLPEVCVPELPIDPANYLPFLMEMNLFETASYSETDRNRTEQYQQEAKRIVDSEKFTNEEDFLKNLKMTAKVETVTTFNAPRVAQLTQRSNQFNLRTVRYSEDEVKSLSENPNYHFFNFSLKDKYGDNGLIAIVVAKKLDNEKLFIENWLMSCRVIKRSMENFTINKIANFAKKSGFKSIVGEYIATPKNNMVKDIYANFEFEKTTDNQYELKLDHFSELKTFIEEKND